MQGAVARGHAVTSEVSKEVAIAEKLLTVEEVAEWLDVKPAWVRAHASGNRSPKLPSVKMGMYRRFLRREVQKFIDDLSGAAR